MRRQAVQKSITEITRRDLIDFLISERVGWSGRLDEVAFLGRTYPLDEMRSYDNRFSTAAGDIRQHRIANYDWDDYWVFDDERFNLRHGPDEAFVAFLAEMLHPIVRSDEEEVARLLATFNDYLRRDGWELVPVDHISGRPIYAGQRAGGVKAAADALAVDRYSRLSQPESIRAHLRRIQAGLGADPPAAISSSKELIETTCKVILDDYGVAYSERDDVMDLYKKTAKALRLRVEDIPDNKRGSDAAQQALRSLVSVTQSLTSLRNALGLGHGRAQPTTSSTRHARLAFNAATAVVEFLLDTWHERPAPR